MRANEELVERTQFKVKDLPVGEKMLFRVKTVNIAGCSPPATLSQAVTIREIVGQRSLSTFPTCLLDFFLQHFTDVFLNRVYRLSLANVVKHPVNNRNFKSLNIVHLYTHTSL